MGRHSTKIEAQTNLAPSDSPLKKRKRGESPSIEIEVDVSAPEPPSKKLLRRAKKGKVVQPVRKDLEHDAEDNPKELVNQHTEEQAQSSKRSEYGIWIGNLPWTATKADLRTFLTQNTGITEEIITRLRMPVPSKTSQAMSQQRPKPQNKGFAYIDFSTQAALDEAVALSEKLFTGRRVLIKDSKNFEGRPEPVKEDGTAPSTPSSKPPSRRMFVGNLGFDATSEDLQRHFEQCGQVEHLQLATFEDSGKCKGYAWVEFAALEGAEAAVRGWINKEQDTGPISEDDEDVAVKAEAGKTKKKPKARKCWVNKLHGRPLRMEFAEDKTVRYKKRFGKDGSVQKSGLAATSLDPEAASMPKTARIGEPVKDRKPSRKVDARTIRPGAALAAAPRSTGAIVEGRGTKVVFD